MRIFSHTGKQFPIYHSKYELQNKFMIAVIYVSPLCFSGADVYHFTVHIGRKSLRTSQCGCAVHLSR